MTAPARFQNGNGYYLMHRGWMTHPVFDDEPYTQREAWAWLIEHAAFQDCRVRVAGTIIDLRRGQVAASLRYLGDQWGWDWSRVKRYLRRLETDTMIATQIDTGITVISIINYDAYQFPIDRDDTPAPQHPTQQRHSSATAAPQEERTKKEDKESKTLPDELPLAGGEGVKPKAKKQKAVRTAEFERWYAAYPLRKAPHDAAKAFAKARMQATLEELIAGAERYGQSVIGKDEQWIAYPATWLNDGRWKDEPGRAAANGHDLSQPRRPTAPPRPEDLGHDR